MPLRLVLLFLASSALHAMTKGYPQQVKKCLQAVETQKSRFKADMDHLRVVYADQRAQLTREQCEAMLAFANVSIERQEREYGAAMMRLHASMQLKTAARRREFREAMSTLRMRCSRVLDYKNKGAESVSQVILEESLDNELIDYLQPLEPPAAEENLSCVNINISNTSSNGGERGEVEEQPKRPKQGWALEHSRGAKCMVMIARVDKHFDALLRHEMQANEQLLAQLRSQPNGRRNATTVEEAERRYNLTVANIDAQRERYVEQISLDCDDD